MYLYLRTEIVYLIFNKEMNHYCTKLCRNETMVISNQLFMRFIKDSSVLSSPKHTITFYSYNYTVVKICPFYYMLKIISGRMMDIIYIARSSVAGIRVRRI